MAIDDSTSYELTGAQVKDLANKIKGKADDNTFVGASSSAPGSKGLVPQPQAGDGTKFLAGDGSWRDTTAKLVEMSYGESNAWSKFINAYNAGSIVYCRASSNANPGTGSQTRKAFMAYVNNATSPTNVEFQYVRSQSSKTDSQQTDQVFVYTLTNASGGTWSVASRNMGPKINVSSPITKTFTSGANATLTLGASTMTGATSSAAGAAGVVPAPDAGDQNKVLTGAGSWVDLAGSYSTSEAATPFTWIDGKTIYKKTYSMGALVNGGGTLVQNISSLDFENVVELRGIAINTVSKNVRPLPLVSNGLSDMVRLDVSNNEIHVITTTGSSWPTAYNVYVTLWYTKTTD